MKSVIKTSVFCVGSTVAHQIALLLHSFRFPNVILCPNRFMQGVLLPSAQYFWDLCQIHCEPDQDKTLIEDE